MRSLKPLPLRVFVFSVPDCFDECPIGSIYDLMVHGGEVDACGAFGGSAVSQCLADDADWDAFVEGDACPGVTGDVHGEWDGKLEHLADTMEGGVETGIVHKVGDEPRGLRGCRGGSAWGAWFCHGVLFRAGVVEAIEEFLHFGFPLDGKRLMGLAAGVGELVVGEVGGMETGDVDEGHASGIVAEKEEVTGLG